MTAWIIEDEPPALRHLSKLLQQIKPEISVDFTTDTVQACLEALRNRPHPDLVFSDIHLADGLSFRIWEEASCQCPIVFTTAYDQYGVRAFRVNSLDYLMKPVQAGELTEAIDRLSARRKPTLQPDWAQLAGLIEQRNPSYRRRFLAQKGQDWVPVRVDDLRQLYSRDGLTFALTKAGQRLLLEETLDRIEDELNPEQWFRINRAQIVHADTVSQASPYFNHRLVLKLKPKGELENIVARARVRTFKTWMGS